MIATSPGTLWALDRLSFRAILMRSTEEALLRTLRSVPIFRSLTSAQIRRLEDVVVEVHYKPGTRVIRQGDQDDKHLYIVSAGKALVHRVQEDSGAPMLLAELETGDYFGERSLLYDEPNEFSVSVAADETSDGSSKGLKCLQISKNDFEELLSPLQDILSADSEWRMHAATSPYSRTVLGIHTAPPSAAAAAAPVSSSICRYSADGSSFAFGMAPPLLGVAHGHAGPTFQHVYAFLLHLLLPLGSSPFFVCYIVKKLIFFLID